MVWPIALLVLLGAQAEQAAPPAKVWSEDFHLVRRPVPVFPDGARVNGGSVDLLCPVGAAGALGRCEVVAEHPGGNGFGRAAVDSMRGLRIAIEPGGPQVGDRIAPIIRFWNGRGRPPG